MTTQIHRSKIQTFRSRGNHPEQIACRQCVAVDDMDNIYVTSYRKLQKFTSSGELIMCVGQRGSKEAEFNGVQYCICICDRNNHRIQVFDLDLNFIRSIGSHVLQQRRLIVEFLTHTRSDPSPHSKLTLLFLLT